MSQIIQKIVQIPLYEVRSDRYDETVERLGDHSDTCFICGKRIKPGREKWVHYLTNGNLISYNGEDIEESQGFFPVGPDCAKKLVIKFAF
jgi:hypothetical protein